MATLINLQHVLKCGA